MYNMLGSKAQFMAMWPQTNAIQAILIHQLPETLQAHTIET